MCDDEAVRPNPEPEPASYQVIPEQSDDDYYEFINLDFETEVFDAAKSTTRKKWLGKHPWIGRYSRSDDEVLFLIPRKRFVLVFMFDRYEDYDGTEDSIKTPPPWIDRELSREDASLWLRLSRHVPPKWLKPVPRRDPSQDPSSRLNREWQPPMVGTLESVDASQELERGETETRADVERMGEPVEVQAGPFAETIRRLKRCTRQAELVRYLWDRIEREAELRLVAKHVFGVSDARFHARKRSVRKQLERTRDSLEAKDCPLRLVISANSVSLRVVQMSS